MKTIFVVDDNNVNLLAAEKALTAHYRVFTLPSASGMFELLEDIIPDLILLDIEMPDTNGFDALKQLKSNALYAGISVVFLTSRSDVSAEVLGFELGAIDFISKPFSEPALYNRLKTHLDIDAIIREQTEELQRLKNSIVSSMARVVESRDELTGKHIERTTMYIKVLLDAMLKSGVYSEEVENWDAEAVAFLARLHDVGKIKVSDAILNKPGKLTDEEFDIMKTHTTEGERIIDDIINESGDKIFLHNARLFAGCHHERWDGTGYPRGLKGEDIPLHGRVMAIADVYDALVSDRPYKKPFSHEQAVDIIIESKGKHFDPKVVDVFLGVSGQFAEVGRCQ